MGADVFGGGPLGFECTNRRNLSSPVLGDTVLVCSFVLVMSLLNGQVTFGIVMMGIFIPGAFHFAGGFVAGGGMSGLGLALGLSGGLI